ncbi:MAG: hypothetical protein PHF87_09995, partial [Desulfotomaculaceae bacterium]|nr:hypothetical protein [Desulfotomaculaceae bacterium]
HHRRHCNRLHRAGQTWARTSVALMAREKLMFGRESNQFALLGSTTRAEATVVLCRVLQKLPQLEK